MTEFEKMLAETKGKLKNLITKETSQEDIKAITAIDKDLDSLGESFTKMRDENNSLKDDLIAAVKGTGFKVDSSTHDDSGVDETPKSIDEIMNESLEKIIKERK